MNLEQNGSVFVLTLDDDDNRFNPDWLARLIGLLREVQAAPAPRALVTIGSGKFWSNGLDLEWLVEHPDASSAFVADVHELLATVLEADFPTVAAIQGHAFAAGAMLAMTHDVRIMRADRGFICFPEVDIRIPFTRGMNSLISAKLSPQTAHQAMVFGRRFGGEAARAAGIVDAAASEDGLLQAAVAHAGELADKDPATLQAIKRQLYAPALSALRSADPADQAVPLPAGYIPR